MNVKKTLRRAALLLLALALCAAVGLAEPAGGWVDVPHEAAGLPAEARAAFDGATEGLDGAEYVPVALLSTREAAGTDYCILCRITPAAPDAASAWALVYIHADPQGGAKLANVYELYIDRHSAPAE